MEAINRGEFNTDMSDDSQAGHEDFVRARREGLRDRWIAVTPDGRHLDAVDFQAEIDARQAAGIAAHAFWSVRLPDEVEK